MGLLAAFQLLTLLPIKRNLTPEQIGRSTLFFPVVGIAIGLVLAGLNYLLSLILPSSLANAFLVAALAAMSGGLHLDGLADTFDGMAGHRTTEERLKVMRDSRVGGFGAIGIALFLLLEYVSLGGIPDHLKFSALILAPVLSRWAMVNGIFFYPYARPDGLGRVLKDRITWWQYLLATLVTAALAVVLFRVAGLAIMAGTWVIIALASGYFKRQLKGLTGDTYGAINEAATIGVLTLITILAFKGWLI